MPILLEIDVYLITGTTSLLNETVSMHTAGRALTSDRFAKEFYNGCQWDFFKCSVRILSPKYN